MRKPYFTYIIAMLLVFASCNGDKATNGTPHFKTDLLLRTTPVKDQGQSRLCWIYAMLSTIETDRLEQEDSVNLSANYLERMMLMEDAISFYTTRGARHITNGGYAPMALLLMEKYGIVPFDSYNNTDGTNHRSLVRKLEMLATAKANQRAGLESLTNAANDQLDQLIGYLPKSVFMLGAEYTPLEFAHSIYKPGSYKGYTSFTHHPYGEEFAVEVADNRYYSTTLNVRPDSLINIIEDALRHHHAVCWEGDVSEPTYDHSRGVANIAQNKLPITAELRQQEFERFRTTDDHCLSIVGMAHDSKGAKYFIAKNSYGTSRPFAGFVYLSYDYILLKTIAIFTLG